MLDLYTPAHYLLSSRLLSRRHNRARAALRYCALFRSKLLLTDRMVVHSDPLFQAWKVDLGIQGLLTSDLVEIGWLEHWPELRYDGRFPGLIGTAEIFDKTKISLNPKEFNAKLHNPQFRSYLASLSGEQQINYSKIFERDEIFTEDVLLGLTDIHHNVIDKLWASVGCTLSASDRQYAVEEFGHLLSLSREAARRDNVDQKDVLGIIRFYPRDHERAGAWGSFFHHLYNEGLSPLLQDLFAKPGARRRFVEWINATYISAESRTLRSTPILGEFLSRDDDILAGAAMNDSGDASHFVVPISSALLTPDYVNMLSPDDILDIRSTNAGSEYFRLLRTERSNLNISQIFDIVTGYIMEIARRVSQRRLAKPPSLVARVTVNVIERADQMLVYLGSALNTPLGSGSIDATNAYLPHKIPVQFVLGLLRKSIDGLRPDSFTGELVFPPSGGPNSVFRLRSK